MNLSWTLLILMTLTVAARALPEDTPVEVRKRAAVVMKLVAEAEKHEDRPAASDEYFAAVRQLGASVSEALERRFSALTPELDVEVVLAARQVSLHPERLAELADLYGRPPEHKPGLGPQVPRRPSLRPDHSVENYRHAWEIWILAPHSEARQQMRETAYRALRAIRNDHSLPVLEAAFRRLLAQDYLDLSGRAYEANIILSSITMLPEERAIEALRRCFLAGKAEKLPSDHFNESLDDYFFRLLTSSLKLEGFPPGGERWKDYEPVIRQQLQKENLPADWRAILERSLALMEKRLNSQ